MPESKGWYVGIGSLQNYSLMGEHKFAVLVDIDPAVSVVHELTTNFLREANEPNRFVAKIRSESAWEEYSFRLNKHNLVDSKRFVRIDPKWATAKQMNEIKDRARAELKKRFFDLQNWCEQEQTNPQSFLGNMELYSSARLLACEHRIKITATDAFSSNFMHWLAGLATYTGVPVTTMYLSNAIAWVAKEKKISDKVFKPLLGDDPTLLFTTKTHEMSKMEEWAYWRTTAKLCQNAINQAELLSDEISPSQRFYALPYIFRDHFAAV